MGCAIAGPFITIGTAGAEDGAVGVLLVNGFGQIGGVAMLIAGVYMERPMFVRYVQLGDTEVTLTPQPLIGKGHGGFGLSGTF